ncbi:LCP family protein [Streptomyces sp. NRRL F-2664]|uniref:LCP family protein n=1 Tax=Streptomyces sp. NRRL F-2664 TaxID=1463842 RepID=UPI00131E35C9|nr:LCP family protein [Streptomyces sp. NRRL F-2664]
MAAAVAASAISYGLAHASEGAFMPGLHRVDVRHDAKIRPEKGAGTNILLMGTDHRGTLTQSEKNKFHAGGVACGCSDVMMLVHLSARADLISVVSLPRDSYAMIPPYNGRGARPAKLNAAYETGGPALAVQAVESMTGVYIDRFLQVDFRRFIDSVDAFTGVEVCTERPLTDPSTHLDLKPGKHHLSGGQALQYVRSRKTDSSADLGRIQRQQRFLVAVLKKFKGAGFTDIEKVSKVSRALLGDATADSGFGVDEMLDLAKRIRALTPSQAEFTVVPVERFHQVPEVGDTLLWDARKASEVFKKLNADQPLTEYGSQKRLTDPPKFFVHEAARGDTLACG